VTEEPEQTAAEQDANQGAAGDHPQPGDEAPSPPPEDPPEGEWADAPNESAPGHRPEPG
jgi:hypothetical protein